MSILERELPSHSLEETQELGRRLGEQLRAGDVVALIGPLGAGKTAFAQGVARGLGVPPEARVASPTFTIVNEHRGRLTLYHVDLYRIGDAGELDEIGLYEYLNGDGVCVVEWFDRVPEAQPPDRLEVEIVIGDGDERVLRLRAHGPEAALRLGALSV
jgi:tRNA threonylcarbamoyladenosine biosynthesis protein TsaE